MGCKLMIRNDVLQGDVGFVVGGGRKKGMGDLFTCPDLLVHSCCWEKLVESKASPKLLVLSPIVSPTKGADGRSCCCSPNPTEPIFPTNSSHVQSLQKPSTPWKKKKKKTSNFVTAFSSPLCLFSLSTTHFPKIHFLSHLLLLQKIAFLNLMKQGAWMNANTISSSVSVCVCVCLCRRLSLSLSVFLSQSFYVSFSKSLPLSAKNWQWADCRRG